MKKHTDIFAEDFEIPGIVNQKMEDAFATIRMEGNVSMNKIRKTDNQKNRKVRLLSKQAAAIIVCVLALGGVTVYAACNYHWSRGMEGSLQSTEVQQQELVETGVATVFHSMDTYTDMAVTSGGVTVTPEMLVVNEKMVYLSLSVVGYDLEEGEEPCFEYIDVYLGNDPMAENGRLNMCASFYNGIISDENGSPMYDDGTPLTFDENGGSVTHYMDEEGKLEYVIVAWVTEPEESLLGQTLQVDISNLGTAYKAAFSGEVEGEWNYTFQLTDTGSMEWMEIGKEVENTVFVLDTIEISPVSIELNYTVNGEVTMYEDVNGVPLFCGVVLKDGTRIPFLFNGGMSGYTDDTLTKAYEISAFDRVIDPDQISAILVRTEPGADMIEIGIER